MKTGPSTQRVAKPETQQPGPWEVVLAGDLSEKGSELLEKLVEVPYGSEGYIFFDTGGGSVYAGLALATTIRLRGLKAIGVVTGECSSAALMPLATCSRRVVTPHSTLLFHPVRWQSDDEMQLEEAAEWARHFQVLEKGMDDLLARLFEIPVERITAWTRPGKFVTGVEFSAAGLADLVDIFSGDVRHQLRQLSMSDVAKSVAGPG